MVKKRVMLTFTEELIREPIIYTLGQQFNVVTNIYRADISEDRGWVVLELEGEEKAATQVLGIGHLDHGPGLFFQQNIPGNLLIFRHGDKAVRAGGVYQHKAATIQGGVPIGDFNGGAGVVGNRNIMAGEEAEDNALAHIGVAYQDDAPPVFGAKALSRSMMVHLLQPHLIANDLQL